MPRALNPNLKLLNGRSEGRDSGGRVVKQTGITRDLPDKPGDLSPAAAEEWDRLTRDLAPVLKAADRASLANLCEVWSDLVRIRKHLRRNGFNMTVKVRDAAGAVTSKRIERPEVRLLTKLLTEHRQLSAQFGATPTSEAAAAKLDTGNGAADAANPFANGAQ